ncbi:MAG TPA: GAF domain-containing protein [Povalibacter sp.]|uniref:GAF domain-containing protein n=1 Tax=Povalibacter sp. TaxID=1962978 RepID=UPI002C0C3644|nr:GAF domain-containing protein [Povalibacter sp.]HMN44322.1 GAF domain-containing protein [Povalibacter sp.]
MTITLAGIRDCLDGQVPAVIATCDLEGNPNGSFVSQVHFVDDDHVALSFQFFNKTRQNILANPVATLMVVHPLTAARYRLHARYLRTEKEGPLFENMKAKLAGIASHTGMAGVFKLQGADVYRVTAVSAVAGQTVLPTPPRRSLLAAVRSFAEATQRWTELSDLLDGALAAIEAQLRIAHSMIHWLDESGERLYLVASRGYAQSGVGSEIQLGQGVIGVAASALTSIRVTHATSEYTYSRAARDSVRASQLADRLEAEIPSPGLPAPGSQLAVPITARGQLLGVLYLEHPAESQFGYDEEDAVVTMAQHLGLAAWMLGQTAAASTERPRAKRHEPAPQGATMAIRHYPADDTLFVDDDYLIKGVAGAILWKLLRDYTGKSRQEFTNRELRLDPTLPLPDLSSNLEARLILLQRRLAERCPCLGIEKTGRGRFRLRVSRPLQLLEAS